MIVAAKKRKMLKRKLRIGFSNNFCAFCASLWP
jgi:hypothetical protein